MKTTIWVISLLFPLLLWAQGYGYLQGKLIPKDDFDRSAAVTYAEDPDGVFKPLGFGGAIFDSLDVQIVADVDDATPSAIYVGDRSLAGLTVTAGASALIVWFDAGVTATGSDSARVAAGTTEYYPVKADTVYLLEVASVPEAEIQTGKIR